MLKYIVIKVKISLLFVLFLILCGKSDKAFSANLTMCGTISAAGSYLLQNNVTSNGTCFKITANDVILDLNGKTVTYDNAAPITVSNGSFESSDMSGWDLTAAPAAVRVAGSYNEVTAYQGSYALKIPAPLTADQSIVTASSYALTAGQPYSASTMMWQPYDINNAANADVHMTIEILSAADNSVLASADSRTVQARYTTRGMQYVSVAYTPSASINIKVRLKVTGARSVTNVGQAPYGAFYFDDVRIQQRGSRAIAADVGWARRFVFKNGNIIQGQAHGDWSHAIGVGGVVGSDTPSYEIAGLEISVSGNSTKAIQATSITNASIHDLLIHSAVDTIEIRDHYDGALIHINDASYSGSIYNVTIDSGIQTGIYARSSTATGRLKIYNNDITLQSKYTNDFGIVSYGNYGNIIYGNTIRCGSGNNTCRGIYLNANGGTVHDNVVDVHYRANNQEYNGCGSGVAAYGIQIESSARDVEVYNNTVTANADECGAVAFRYYGPDATTSLNNNVYNNTFKAVEVNGSSKLASVVAILQTYSQHLTFTNNILITNCNWLGLGQLGTSSLDRSLILDNNTFQLSYPKGALYVPLMDETYSNGTNAPRNITLSNNIYADSTVAADLSTAKFKSYYSGYAVDPFAFNVVITAKGAPVAPSPPQSLQQN